MPSDPLPLRSDCRACAALCCIAYAAEESPAFSASKDAGQPCLNLDDCGACKIYEEREAKGFSACLKFECFGAGQRVVQHAFDGHDWRDDPALLAPMLECFVSAKKACELLILLSYAKRAGPAEGQNALLEPMAQELEAISLSRHAASHTARLGELEGALHALLRKVGPPQDWNAIAGQSASK